MNSAKENVIYAVFSDWTDGDEPSTLHFIGTSLDSIDLTTIEAKVKEDEEEEIQRCVYVCKFDLVNGGLNLSSLLVGFNAEPALIDEHKIFRGTYAEFEQYITEMYE